MNKVTNIEFCIAAAKDQDYDEKLNRFMPDWKVIDSTKDCAEAMEKFRSVSDYPIVEFHIETTFDNGTRIRVPVFGGITEKLINGLWEPD